MAKFRLYNHIQRFERYPSLGPADDVSGTWASYNSVCIDVSYCVTLPTLPYPAKAPGGYTIDQIKQPKIWGRGDPVCNSERALSSSDLQQVFMLMSSYCCRTPLANKQVTLLSQSISPLTKLVLSPWVV